MLAYSTPVLTEPMTIAGDVSAVLYVSADVEDTDVCPSANVTLHHGEGHESALIYRAYLGDVTIDTPFAALADPASG